MPGLLAVDWQWWEYLGRISRNESTCWWGKWMRVEWAQERSCGNVRQSDVLNHIIPSLISKASVETWPKWLSHRWSGYFDHKNGGAGGSSVIPMVIQPWWTLYALQLRVILCSNTGGSRALCLFAGNYSLNNCIVEWVILRTIVPFLLEAFWTSKSV